MANTHQIKTMKPFFKAVWEGTKTFEIRYNDRNYKTGDILELMEVSNNAFTGRKIVALVTYTLWRPEFGVKIGYILMAIKVQSRHDKDGSETFIIEHDAKSFSHE